MLGERSSNSFLFSVKVIALNHPLNETLLKTLMKMLVHLYHDIHLDLNIHWTNRETMKSPYAKSIKTAPQSFVLSVASQTSRTHPHLLFWH